MEEEEVEDNDLAWDGTEQQEEEDFVWEGAEHNDDEQLWEEEEEPLSGSGGGGGAPPRDWPQIEAQAPPTAKTPPTRPPRPPQPGGKGKPGGKGPPIRDLKGGPYSRLRGSAGFASPPGSAGDSGPDGVLGATPPRAGKGVDWAPESADGAAGGEAEELLHAGAKSVGPRPPSSLLMPTLRPQAKLPPGASAAVRGPQPPAQPPAQSLPAGAGKGAGGKQQLGPNGEVLASDGKGMAAAPPTSKAAPPPGGKGIGAAGGPTPPPGPPPDVVLPLSGKSAGAGPPHAAGKAMPAPPPPKGAGKGTAIVAASSDGFVEMHFDPAAMGFIIGKQGAKIKEIKVKSGADVQVQIVNDRVEVKIAGPPARVLQAQTMVKEVVENGLAKVTSENGLAKGGASVAAPADGLVELHFDTAAMGFIIGKKGAMIKEVRAESGANVQVEQVNDRVEVKITGSRAQVLQAQTMVKEVVEMGLAKVSSRRDGGGCGDGGPAPIVLELDASSFGSIVGKAGAHIKEVRATCGVEVRVDQDPAFVKVTIRGTGPAAEKAKAMILELADGNMIDKVRQNFPPDWKPPPPPPKMLLVPPASFQQQKQQQLRPQPPQQPPQQAQQARTVDEDGKVTETIQFEKTNVSAIIGVGGVKVKEMRAQTGASIKAKGVGEGVAVEISGTPQQVQKAKALASEAVEAHKAKEDGADAGGGSQQRQQQQHHQHMQQQQFQKGQHSHQMQQQPMQQQQMQLQQKGAALQMHPPTPQQQMESAQSLAPANAEDEVIVMVNKEDGRKIIGNKGANVKRIRADSGATVKLTLDADPCGCNIFGTVEAVDKARGMIHDLLQQSGWGEDLEWQSEEFMKVSSVDSKNILGKGGETVKEIENTTWAKVEIQKVQLGPRLVRVTGSIDAVEQALAKIKDAIAPWGNKAAGGGQKSWGNKPAWTSGKEEWDKRGTKRAWSSADGGRDGWKDGDKPKKVFTSGASWGE